MIKCNYKYSQFFPTTQPMQFMYYICDPSLSIMKSVAVNFLLVGDYPNSVCCDLTAIECNKLIIYLCMLLFNQDSNYGVDWDGPLTT